MDKRISQAPNLGASLSGFASIRLAFCFALRELRGGLAGFYIFLACIALGVAAIGGVGSASKALTGGLAEQGREILGGDISLSLTHRRMAQDERAFVARFGQVSEIATMRAMARTENGSDQMLVEIKAVDGLYPLVGSVSGQSQPKLDAALQAQPADAVFVSPILLDRMDLKVGDPLVIGSHSYVIKDAIDREPDALATGIGFGPRILMSLAALDKSELVQPGSIVRWTTRLVTPQELSIPQISALIDEIKAEYPDAGWRIQSRANAAEGLSRNIERFAAFLVLIGLASLITGGVGIANAVRAFIASRQSVIASYKCLGAPGWLIVSIYLAQVVLIALVGIAIGLFLAALVPVGLRLALPENLPLASNAIYWLELTKAAAFGLLTALLFSLWPLLRAKAIPATALFRDQVTPVAHKAGKRDWALLALLGGLLVALVLGSAQVVKVAAVFLIGMVIVFGLFRLIAVLIMKGAARLPRLKSVIGRLAVTNLHRPGALTPSVSLSLGLGLSLLVTLVLIDLNLQQQLSGSLQEKAPNFFFVNIQNSQVDEFEARLDELAPEGERERVPMLRGRVLSLKGIDVADYKTPNDEGRWILRGDRGITYSATMPENSKLVSGEWWPENYSGKPLVSFDEEGANELGLKAGDSLTVSVLGRQIEATIHNLRRIEWESMGINFVMVFSPNTFAGAPHSHLATLAIDPAQSASKDVIEKQEATIMKEIVSAFPSVTSVRVGDALDRVNDLVRQLAWGMRSASSLAVLASILVLAGALAAGQRERTYDAVILKTLGASRKQILSAYCLEYGLLGLVTAVFALLIGHVASYLVLENVMEISFAMQPLVALATVALAVVLTIALGLAGTWSILSKKPARILRSN